MFIAPRKKYRERVRVRGTCHVYLAVDLGFAIDLARAERVFAGDQIQQNFKRPRRAPEAAQLQRRSLRVAQSGFPVEVGKFRSDGPVEIALWEFGAASFEYAFPLDAELGELVTLSDQLWDNPEVLRDAKKRAAHLLSALGDTVAQPKLGARMEDYVAFELRLPPGTPPSVLWTSEAATTASILRAEPGPLSEEEISDALSRRCAYVPNETVIVDWYAALLVGDDMDDERLVLELSVAELLELRDLDDRLDRGIDAAYAILIRKKSWLSSLHTRAEDLAFVSQLQADAAVLFEGADNALKLLGDQYLARLYKVVSERFHLPHWDAAIERKLRVLDGIFEKLTQNAATRRFEVLEVVVIVLIAVEVAAAMWARLGG
jgi:hypothetical protein